MSHESGKRMFPELENLEKAEASLFIKQIKTALLTDQDAREAMFKSMSTNPPMKRLVNEFGKNEKTKNFLINEFFAQQQNGITLPKDEYQYSINWDTSFPHLGEAITITKRPASYDAPYQNEQVSINNWKYPRLSYEHAREENKTIQRVNKKGLDAKENIETFLKHLFPPKPLIGM